MRFRRRHAEAVPAAVDAFPAYVDAVARMPVQCLMFDDRGSLCVVGAIPLGNEDFVELDLIMSESPFHPPITPASWLDQYLDRWHHGRFAGWRLRGEYAGQGQAPCVHPDLGVGTIRPVHPAAGVHVLGPYIRYGTGSSTGARQVRVDHDQRCAAILFHRTVEAGIPIADLAAQTEHPSCRGVAQPPLPPRDAAPASEQPRPGRGPSLRTLHEPGGIMSGTDPA